jgi:subtilisin family serine protease
MIRSASQARSSFSADNAMHQAIRNVVADGRVTEAEWSTVLRPQADALPRKASAEARQLVDVWASSRFELDGGARRQMADFLQSRGYAVPRERPQGVSATALAKRMMQSNVSEKDTGYEQLVERAGRASHEVNVAVLDNGFDMWHPELGPKGWANPAEVPGNGGDEDGNGKVDDSHGWDFVDGNNDTGHPGGDWHGTHVAGIASQGTDRVNVMPMRVLGPPPYDVRKVAEAVEYAIERGAKVINLSFGFGTAERMAVMRELMARHPQVLFVAAAGNDSRPLEQLDPNLELAANRLPNLVVVAASDEQGRPASMTNYGSTAGLAAQGADVMSTIPGAGYSRMSGTSMAAPQVTNLSARMLVLDPALSPTALKRLMTDSSDVRADWQGKVASGGTINMERAARLAALTGLVRGGKTVEAAAAQLGLTGTERQKLVALVNGYLQEG